MIAWIRFFLTAALLISALICFAGAVTGVWRFGFVLNRLHAAGIGDTLGLFLLVLAMMLGSGWSMTTLKLLLLFVLLWFTSPVSSHFLSQIEYYTNPDLFEYTDRNERLGKMTVKNPNELIREIFDISGISNFVIYEDEEPSAKESEPSDDEDDEWQQKMAETKQKMLEHFSAHNDVVMYQMKLGQNE